MGSAMKTMTPQDVLALRRQYYSDVSISAQEMERLFAIAEASPESSAEWTRFFVEAGVDYLVNQVEPHGYMSEANTTWLLDRVTRDGKVCAVSELELLVKAIEMSRSVPPRLVTFALQQVSDAVLHGEGPLAHGGALRRGVITREETDLVRRIIHAMGDDSNIGIDQEEAEMLFLMNDKSIHAENDPSWNELFVKAIANYVVGNARPRAPDAEDQLRWKAALEDNSNFFQRAASGSGRAWSEFFTNPGKVFGKRQPSEAALRNEIYEAQTKAAETVTSPEAQWLAAKIDKDGELHGNERELLKFIKEISPSVDKSLEPLMRRVA